MANILVKLILFNGAIALSGSALSAVAEPLRGYAEQSNAPMRIQRPSDTPQSAIQGNVNQDAAIAQPPLVQTDQFNIQVPRTQLPANSEQFAGSATSGRDEYWVSWDTWRHRVADAVWQPIKSQQIVMWGRTRVDYNVTRDLHIQIISVTTPDPTGQSGQILEAAIMRLEGNPILAFPVGSKQMIHRNYNMEIGLPIPSRTRHSIYLPGGSEHVINQW